MPIINASQWFRVFEPRRAILELEILMMAHLGIWSYGCSGTPDKPLVHIQIYKY